MIAEKQETGIRRYIPILAWLPKYQSKWLRLDIIAGLTIMALLVPEGMAYAQLAGMPPQTACVLIGMGFTADDDMQLIKDKRAVADPDARHIQKRIRKFESQWQNQKNQN